MEDFINNFVGESEVYSFEPELPTLLAQSNEEDLKEIMYFKNFY